MTFRAPPRADSAGTVYVAPPSVPARSVLRPMRLFDWARVWWFSFLIVMAEREYAAHARRAQRKGRR